MSARRVRFDFDQCSWRETPTFWERFGAECRKDRWSILLVVLVSLFVLGMQIGRVA